MLDEGVGDGVVHLHAGGIGRDFECGSAFGARLVVGGAPVDGFEHSDLACGQPLSNPLQGFVIVKIPGIVLGREHPENSQSGIEPLLQFADGLKQSFDAPKRQVVGLHRHDHRVRRRHGIHREESQGRRAVDEDKVVAVANLPHLVPQYCWRRQEHIGNEFRFGVRQGDARRDERGVLAQNERFHGCVAQQPEIQGFLFFLQGVRVMIEIHGQARLRVGVDGQYPLTSVRECIGEVDGGSGFSHPAFLIGDGDDGAHRELFKRGVVVDAERMVGGVGAAGTMVSP